jgi:CheY-like chemotaxis protein
LAVPVAPTSSGFVRKHFEYVATEDLLPLGHRRGQIGVADRDDPEIGVEHEIEARSGLEERSEVRLSSIGHVWECTLRPGEILPDASASAEGGAIQSILICDDDEVVRSLVTAVLGSGQYAVREASNVEEALDELAAAPPDLVVLDFHMPGGGGPAVLDKIRGDPGLAETPVLLVSGTLESLDRDWAEKVGADEHLSKPFPVETFKGDRSRTLESSRRLVNMRVHRVFRPEKPF